MGCPLGGGRRGTGVGFVGGRRFDLCLSPIENRQWREAGEDGGGKTESGCIHLTQATTMGCVLEATGSGSLDDRLLSISAWLRTSYDL